MHYACIYACKKVYNFTSVAALCCCISPDFLSFTHCLKAVKVREAFSVIFCNDSFKFHYIFKRGREIYDVPQVGF